MALIINLIALKTIARREITRILRIWLQTLVPPVITISLYFIIFGNLIGHRIGVMQGVNYINYIVPGLIMMSIITNAYSNVVSSFFGAKFQHYIEEMLISPMPNYIILWGFLIGGIFRGIIVGLLVAIVSVFFANMTIYSISLMILVAILTAILFSLAGIINGIFANKFDDISIIPTFVLTPLTYLGGVFYSIDLLPDFWQLITYFNPIFYMINAFSYGMLGSADIGIVHSISVIVIFIVIFYTISIWLLHKGIAIKN